MMICFALYTQHFFCTLTLKNNTESPTFNFSKNMLKFNEHTLMTTNESTSKLFLMTQHKRWFDAYPLPNYMTKSHLVYQHNKMR